MSTVLLRFTLSFVYKVYIGFLSPVRDWTVAVAQNSKFACSRTVYLKIWLKIFNQSILSILSRAYKSKPCMTKILHLALAPVIAALFNFVEISTVEKRRRQSGKQSVQRR
jgi:hypothetical protein